MKTGNELIKIMCDSSMRATALHLANPSKNTKEQAEKIMAMPDKYAWLSETIKPILITHYEKFVEDMKPLVELEMMPDHNKEQWLQQTLNAECNLIAVEVIRAA